MNRKSNVVLRTIGNLLLLTCAGAWLASQAGCSRQKPASDPAPFLQAVDNYLQTNHMELKVKEVKAGPVVEHDQATMTASLTHAELGGPAVTWNLKFKRLSDGTWQVIEHAVAK